MRKMKILYQKIKRTNPAIVFLQETKCQANFIQERRSKIWARCESMGIDSTGFSGGLCILWDPSQVSLSDFQGTRNSISANFKVVGFPISGALTNVYGPQHSGDKRSFLKSLSNLKTLMPLEHWVVGGDFNLINSLEEKKGGRRCLEEECNLCHNTIEDLGLVDITLGVGWFTWNNKRTGDRHIASRLDRFLVYESVINLGSEIHSSTLSARGSDHWPIELMWSGLGSQFKNIFVLSNFGSLIPNLKIRLKPGGLKCNPIRFLICGPSNKI